MINVFLRWLQVEIIHRNTTRVVGDGSGAPSTLPVVTQAQGQTSYASSRDTQSYKTSGDILPESRSVGNRQPSPMDYRSRGSPGHDFVDLGAPGQGYGDYNRGPPGGPPRGNPVSTSITTSQSII